MRFAEMIPRYRPDEIARRAGLFYVAAAIGTCSTGFLAARIFANLDGALGRAGWRWMFLISGVVTLPVAIFGYITFPGTPDNPKKWLFTDTELALSRARMKAVGRQSRQTVSINRASLKRFLGRWHFWVLVPWSIIFQQGYLTFSQGAYSLWIKSQKQYSTVKVNNLTTIAPCSAILFIVAFAWLSDRYGHKATLPLFAFAHLIEFLGQLAFVAYDHTPVGYKWFGVAVSQVSNCTVPIMYSWANLICAGDAEERAFVLSSMLAFAMAFNSWVPILLLPTVEAPRFFKGYLEGLIAQPVAFALAVLVYYLDRERRRPQKVRGGSVQE
jgi:MFS family permease